MLRILNISSNNKYCSYFDLIQKIFIDTLTYTIIRILLFTMFNIFRLIISHLYHEPIDSGLRCTSVFTYKLIKATS